MIRLSQEDFKNPAELERCATVTGLSPEAFTKRFEWLAEQK